MSNSANYIVQYNRDGYNIKDRDRGSVISIQFAYCPKAFICKFHEIFIQQGLL